MKAILFFLLFFSFLNLFSQNETGIRALNYNYSGVREEALTFQQIFPIIRNIPPVDTIMPIEVKNAYLAVDSLAKKMSLKRVENYINDLRIDDEEFIYILRNIYLIQEYDYIRFEQYVAEIKYNNLGGYKLQLSELMYALKDKISESNDPKKYKKLSLIDCGIILKVEVVKIDSMQNPIWFYNSTDSGKYVHYKLTLKVLDTLKGTILPKSNNNSLKQREELQSFSFPTFTVEFGKGSVPQITHYSDMENSHYRLIDLTMFDQHKNMLRFRLNDTAIIFIKNVVTMSNRENDYLRLSLKNFYGYPVFPVRNGLVRDVNRIWSNDEFTPYETWKNTFNNVKNAIKGFGE